jgi:hypothetical protein
MSTTQILFIQTAQNQDEFIQVVGTNTGGGTNQPC